MKSALSVVVAAAGVQQASATFGLLGGGGISFNFGLDWSGAKTFPCPGNVVNKCTPEQENDWDWSDVATGSLNTYAGFNFGGGWSCESNFGKRGDIQGRTFGLGKVISGSCNQGDEAGLSIGVGASAGIDAFSINSFDMSTEFDARLEFHYDMPDGSVCKQTSDCKRGGSTIVNNQCGGAKKVRVIYPKQIIHKGISFSKKCKISCHKIKWHCGKPTPKPSTSVLTLPSTSTQVIQTTPVTTLQTYTTPSQQTTPEKQTTSSKETTTSAQQTTPGKETTPAQQTTPSKETTPVQQTTSSKETTPAQQTTPGKETTPSQETTSAHQTTPGKETTPAQQTTPSKETTPAQQTTPGKETTPAQQTTPGKETTPAQQTTPGQQTTPSQPTTAATTTPATTFVTTYDTTSTVFTTSTKTITSCGPEVTECPGKTGPHIVTVTIPVSTTICPVTETRTQSQGVPTTVILPSKSETTIKEQPTPEQPTGEKPNPVTSQPPQSTQTPPCPPVVPRCLNTFVDLKAKCADNKDASCFCPDKDFVKNIFDCIYAHGESDNVISEAISFFQGICGRYIPENPVIATGAETITQIITVTGTPHITQVPYTTVVVATTITENSSTQTISTEVTIPNIVMPTPTGGVPNQPPATASVPAGQNPPPVTGQNPPPAVTDQSPPPAITTGTGGVIPPKPTGSVPVTAGSGRVGAGLGMVLAVAAFVAAL
ncbi:adhesin protein Mad1 [Metarhizium brunneum]|uniref:Adhesin protein Mad1 n=1 Tax=Metarhizium anisopliae TaxID=5530 RepID=A0A6M4C8P2_METAN|nr:adhesin protein Mad1 [Metarhizium anisopliae]